MAETGQQDEEQALSTRRAANRDDKPTLAADSSSRNLNDQHVNNGKGDETTGNNVSAEKPRRSRRWWPRMAVRFGVRLSIVLTSSSLFVLVQNPDNDDAYPQGTWVFVSALMVSWFPSMDVASVAEKTMQRILGTICGAFMGVACGFLSSLIEVYSLQALFIGICIAVVTFSVSFSMVEFETSIFANYPYASLLCLLTFGISVLPFYTDNEKEWKSAVFRIANVIIGCGIAAIGAILLWPRSSMSVLGDAVQEQVKFAGEASEAVLLFASETLTDRSTMNSGGTSNAGVTESKIGVEPDVDDSAHQKYEKAIGKYKAAKSAFPLAKYDPYNLCRDTESYEAFRKESALTLSRALRIQTTIVLIDGALRNDELGVRCTDRQRDLFGEIGSLIKTMLTPPCNQKVNDVAADELLDLLDEIRAGVLRESAQVAAAAAAEPKFFFGSLGKEDFKEMLGAERAMPLMVHNSESYSLLFLQLVEQLVIRNLRLYYMWRQVDKENTQADSSRGRSAVEETAYRD